MKVSRCTETNEYLTSVNAVHIEDLEGWWLSSCCKLSTSGRTLVAQARSPGFHCLLFIFFVFILTEARTFKHSHWTV